jgi:hypothetical protein
MVYVSLLRTLRLDHELSEAKAFLQVDIIEKRFNI